MSNQEQVLVTGITGFIAKHVAIKALERGYTVRGTVRSMKKADRVRETLSKYTTNAADKLNFVEADLSSDTGWDDAVENCRYVLHVASPFPSVQPKDRYALVPEAKEGTLRVLRAAAKASVDHVVVTSSMASIIYRDVPPGDTQFTEEDWANPNADQTTSYYVSKVVAEKAAWDFIKDNPTDMKLTTICPGFVMGPELDIETGTSASVIVDMMKGKMPAAPKAGFMTVHVDDVAEAHLRALEVPEAAGERFAAVSDFLWFKDYGAIIAAKHPAFARKMPKFTAPDFAVKLLARIDGSVAAVVPDLGRRRLVSNQKAREILKMEFKSGRKALEDMAKSIVDLNLV
ncbi:MAG: aldehyde reductase [Pseudomonadota bacterium]